MSPFKDCKPANLVGPFKERLRQAAEQSRAPPGSNDKDTAQHPGLHGMQGKQRLAPGRNAAGSLKQPNQERALGSPKAATDKQPRLLASNASSLSSSRPASKRAVNNIAAAEAAVSAAAAVLKAAQEPQRQQHLPQAVHTPGASQLEQQLQQGQKVIKVTPKSGLGDPPESSCTSASVLAQDGCCEYQPKPLQQANLAVATPLLAPLQVQGRKAAGQQQQPQHQACVGSRPTDAAQDAVGDLHSLSTAVLPSWTSTQSPGSNSSATHSHQQQQEVYKQLLQYSGAAASSLQQSPAIAAAAHAVDKRLRIQQRSRQGPPAYQRRPLPRPNSPPPVELTGALILSSCPDAVTPSEVCSADLSSANISSIQTPAAAFNDMSAADRRADAADQHLTQPTLDNPGAGMATGLALPNFTELGVLDLSDNRLSCIAGLAWLPALWQLAVSANRLRTLQSLSQVLGYHTPEPPAEATAEDQVSIDQACSGSKRVSIVQVSRCSSLAARHESSINDAAAPTEPSQQARPDSDSCPDLQQGYNRCLYVRSLVATAADAIHTAGATVQPAAVVCFGGFSQLQVLDVSYNMLPADELLGRGSPLAELPRLVELLAAGNGLCSLPADLGPFTSLTHLDLAHNRLTGAALIPLGQLPVLSQLLLPHNPIKAAPDRAAGATADGSSTLATAAELHASSNSISACGDVACNSYKELTWLDLSHSRVSDAEQLVALLQLPKLCVLQLVGSPLAHQCGSGRDAVQALEHDGVTVITHEQEPLAVWQHNPKHRHKHHKRHLKQHAPNSSSGAGRLLPITVQDDASAGHTLAAAGKNIIMGLQHEQVLAAFQRIDEGIDNWQLAPVAEEDSTALQLAEEECGDQKQDSPKKMAHINEDEPIVDQTFLTGVGITGELPDESDQAPADTDQFQDPTERLALALGLQVTQLAHYTHSNPGNPTGAIHKLRHALTHQLVDPEAGQRPQQHHASMTAAAAAKQRPRQLLPLPQPIPTALDTRMVVVQGIDSLLQNMRGRLQALEGSLLQQLQAQADKLTATSQHMTENGAADAGIPLDGPAQQPVS